MAIINNLAFLAFSGGGEGPQSMLLDVNPGLIIWVTITFVALLFILKKMAWGPILNSLKEREETHFLNTSDEICYMTLNQVMNQLRV